jgi:hypothetical protein
MDPQKKTFTLIKGESFKVLPTWLPASGHSLLNEGLAHTGKILDPGFHRFFINLAVMAASA